MSPPIISVLLAQQDPVQLAALVAMVEKLRPDWVIAGKITALQDIIQILDESDPSFCITDVNFHGINSIDFMQRSGELKPIIFYTHELSFAADAFNENAIDFVLKPASPERMEQAFRKIEAYLGKIISAPLSAVSSMTINQPAPRIVRMFKGRDLILSPLDKISYFQAQRKYTRVVMREQEGLLRMGLTLVAEYLPPDQFVKIHRSIIVNMAEVQNAKRDTLGRLTVGMVGLPEQLIIARPYEYLFRDGIF
jgi:DNA-binding LytR/AlgR family response regulator